MATRKTGGTPQIDDAFLSTVRKVVEPEQKEPQDLQEKEPTEAKKTCISLKVNATTVKTWKQFCLDKDLTLTDAIKRAMTHYMKDVRNGTIEL